MYQNIHSIQRYDGMPPNFRFKYTQKEVDDFKNDPGKYRNKLKFHRLSYKNGKIMKINHEVIPDEKITETLLKLWSNPDYGFSGIGKLFDKVQQLYVGITRQDVANFLKQNETSQIHSRLKTAPISKPIIVKSILGHVQIDLTNWWKYRGYNNQRKYLLAMLDLATKYLWVEPLLNKESITVWNGFRKILDRLQQSGLRLPRIVQSDNGSEFMQPFSTECKNVGITQVFSQSHAPTTQGGIERVQGYVKKKVGNYFTQYNTRVWLNIIQRMVDNYNNEKHGTTGFSPRELLFGVKDLQNNVNQIRTDKARKDAVIHTQDKAEANILRSKRDFPELVIGDYVRIALVAWDAAERMKQQQHQRKSGSVENYTREVFQIVKITKGGLIRTVQRPQTFKLSHLDGTLVKGLYFRDRLLKTVHPDKIINKPKDINDDHKKLDDVPESDVEMKDSEVKEHINHVQAIREQNLPEEEQGIARNRARRNPQPIQRYGQAPVVAPIVVPPPLNLRRSKRKKNVIDRYQP